MGSLNETASWDASVPYFAADAILTGGPDCPDNIPIQALANRTAFLKKQIDDAVSGALVTMSAKKLQTARNIAMTGDGAWSVNFDGAGNATAAMSLVTTGIAAGTYPVITVDAKGRATAGRALQSGDLPNSAALTGTPTAPTAPPGTNTTQIATAAFVQAAIAALVASSPAALDTLNELATALGNDPNFATTMMNALALKAPLSSPPLSGIPTAPTAAPGTNTNQLATTAFAQALMSAAGFGMVDVGVYIGNLDDVSFGAGFYYFNSGSSNVPIPNAQGVVLHKIYGSGGFQLLQSYSNDRLLWRKRSGGVWSQWNEVANIASPAFTGTPTAPTAAPGTNTNQLATAAFVQAAISAFLVSSPTFTGIPTAPTAAPGTNTKQLATAEFVQAAISAVVGSAPETLNALNELAAALGNDPNFATTMINALAGKASIAGSATQAFSVLSASQGQHAASFAQLTGVVGSARKLRMYLPAAASSVQITADTIIAETAAGLQYRVNGFNQALNLATIGIGGMDTGAAPVNGYVAIYAAFNPTNGTSGVFATNATASAAGNVYGGANTPAGYTATALLTVVPTNASGQIKPCLVRDRRVSLPATSVLSTSTTAGSYTSLSIAGAVPLNAVSVRGSISFGSSTSSAQGVVVAGDAAGIDYCYGSVTSAGGGAGVFDVQMATAQSIYYTFSCSSGTPSLSILISGYTI